MRVLLVQPPLDKATSKIAALGIAEPLGLEYVAASIPEHDVTILDLRVGGALENEIERMDPHLVGVSSVSVTIQTAIDLLRSAKAMNPHIVTVMGGVHATLMPEDCQVDGVDVIVQGEGEETTAELVSALSNGIALAGIPGLMYRDGSGWNHNSPRLLPPLDSYPFPARHLTAQCRPAYSRVGMGNSVFVASSRGCSRRCSFCSVWRTHGGKYRTRSAQSLVEELAKRDEVNVDLVDDDSFGDVARMEMFRQLVDELLPGRAFKALVRADTVVRHPDLFERWARTGLRLLVIGLESFSDDELADLNKKATSEQNRRAVGILQELGIGVVGYLIVRPEYTRDDFARLSDTVEQLGIAQPVFTTLTPFPGTVLFEEVKHRLTTQQWEHFDGFRSVLPTALPAPEFYEQLAGLYRRAYAKQNVGYEGEIPWFEQLARCIEAIASGE